ncbi:xanthine dehydrogenase accessory protein XdhC [Oleomonas cavernae]|uniref:xanthine dehydrogenase accessory protein XdhC n=1 Tax=Oleomonas cavernae TaxID=2320859 RepID=UPI001F305800|nr:xanthine dehydrogenase accessory protein XdhC [Oleomonas cavernae]
MDTALAQLVRALAATGAAAILVSVREAQGSTPRDAGTMMLVTTEAIHGTIGGGRLEWTAIARAREMIAAGELHALMSLPLGPALDQCCGGHVLLSLDRVDAALADKVEAAEREEAAGWPTVLLFGAGHVGAALAQALRPLPLVLHWFDERAEAAEGAVAGDLEGAIAAAPPGSAVLVMTHDHPLDFRLTALALARGDLAYVGMIGSATKRARLIRHLGHEGYNPALADRLTCPIGGRNVRDKRPAVIAALVAAELLAVLSP